MNARLHELAMAAARGEITPPVVMIAGTVGCGKTFTARVITRWALRRKVPACTDCGPDRLVRRGNGWGACECTRRKPFTVEHIHAFRIGDAARSLLTIFTLSEGFDERADAARGRIADMLACSLLIIDDLGSERNPPPTFEPALSSLVEQRTERRLPTWIITNITGNEIENRYKARAHSRIVNPAETVLIRGRDRRKRTA